MKQGAASSEDDLNPDEEQQRRKVPLGVTLFDPSGFFRLLCDVFTQVRYLVYLIWPMAILGTIAALNNWYTLQAHVDRIFLSFSFFQSLVISLMTANLFSKIFLGTTMAYHGADSHQFGIRLLFGVMPRFFVNKRPVRDLSFRNQRSCYSAPLLTKLAMYGVGMVMWDMLRLSGSGAADLFLVLSMTGMGAFIFTVNPLWPADGYNWMAAYLERPQLRRQSLRLTHMVLTRKKLPDALHRGEAFALFAYAVSAVIFTAVIIFSVLRTLAYALEAQLRGTGVVIFCILLAMLVVFLLSLKTRKGKKSAVVDTSKARRRATLKKGQ